ncbi:hypothetical protein AB0D54_14425 [Streptomyces xanthophaeus]|uniref:hypothetical protein n=1 Tax=Streptomyces xanthophaeus TaxID=67385 RepID=UPI0034245D95
MFMCRAWFRIQRTRTRRPASAQGRRRGGRGGGDTYSTYLPHDIDEKGRISGTYEYSPLILSYGVTWQPPYTETTYAPNLGERTRGSFEDVSPITGVSVGTASDSNMVGPFPPDTAPPHQATLWKAPGPPWPCPASRRPATAEPSPPPPTTASAVSRSTRRA